MTDLEWLLMAADRARELPDPHLDWKWARLGDSVIFAVSDHPPRIEDFPAPDPPLNSHAELPVCPGVEFAFATVALNWGE